MTPPSPIWLHYRGRSHHRAGVTQKKTLHRVGCFCAHSRSVPGPPCRYHYLQTLKAFSNCKRKSWYGFSTSQCLWSLGFTGPPVFPNQLFVASLCHWRLLVASSGISLLPFYSLHLPWTAFHFTHLSPATFLSLIPPALCWQPDRPSLGPLGVPSWLLSGYICNKPVFLTRTFFAHFWRKAGYFSFKLKFSVTCQSPSLNLPNSPV